MGRGAWASGFLKAPQMTAVCSQGGESQNWKARAKYMGHPATRMKLECLLQTSLVW